MKLSSPSFKDNEMIPERHTGFGEDISPELSIADAPEETVTFAVVLDDLDVPWAKEYNHWLVWNIPKTEVIPVGLPKGASISDPIKACQGAAWGKNRYRGPKPPFFLRKAHRYVFTVYALDSELELPADAKKQALVDAMNGHILAQAAITGLFGNDMRKRSDN